MEKKPHISLPIIVEGKYDKNTLSQLVDALILPTDGFAVFHAKERQEYLRRVTERCGAILLTDSDGGGAQIRSFLLGILPHEKLHILRIPKLEGKEKRKKKPSRAGTLGVEGMPKEILLSLLAPFFDGAPPRAAEPITKTDLYLDGLFGGENSSERRAALCRLYGFPDDLGAGALLEALNLFSDAEEYRARVATLQTDPKGEAR